MNKTRHYIQILLLMLLLVGGTGNEAWAYKVTYHVLTLPMNSTRPGNTKSEYDNWRMEAIKVIVNNGTIVELPAKYKSPLAKDFKYYTADKVTKYAGGTAQTIYPNHSYNKYVLYQIAEGDTPEGSAITANCDIYVTYEYYEDNTIADLTGNTVYNIGIHGGFLSFNKGRNNRLAVIPKKYNGSYIIGGDQICSDNFSKIDLNGKGTGITTWWSGNLTPRATADSYFHFLFKYKGEDPYNITICTAYEGNDYYFEKYSDSETKALKRLYESSSLFSSSTGTADQNLLFASDDNRQYKTVYDSSDPVSWLDKPGYYRDIKKVVWNSFTLLNNDNNDGYVYMGTRCIESDGSIKDPTNNQYYYLKAENNTMTYSLMTSATATKNYSVDKKMYELVTYTFYVKTKFGNTISATKKWSEAYLDVELEPSHVPASLLRKYCTIVGFYKDAALTQKITTFGDAEDMKIYVKYEVSGAPFEAINPSDSYTTASWYELTDAGSTQENYKKLEYDETAIKNKGDKDDYNKMSEFAFVGDPYEMRVLYRNTTTSSQKSYVGSSSGSSTLGVATSDYSLQETNDFTYGTSYTYETENFTTGTKTITFNISGLNGGKKIKITKGGVDATQVASTTPTIDTATEETSTTETIYVTLHANIGAEKTITITIQEYELDGTTSSGTPTTITIKQLPHSYTWEIPYDETNGSFLLQQFSSSNVTTPMYWEWITNSPDNDVTIGTTGTRVKMMDLPTFTYVYNIVDTHGNIAIKGTGRQTIFTSLNGYANIPEAIRSPFLSDEDISFFSTLSSEGSRDNLGDPIYEAPPTNEANIYVSYTTVNLSSKGIPLDNSKTYNVKLNDNNIYADNSADNSKVLSNSSPSESDLDNNQYLWSLVGEDPYAMKIYNWQESKYVKVNDGWGDNKGLDFDEESNASQFIAMAGNYIGIYEVMAATGTFDLYHIGRATDDTQVKIYSTSTYAHGADQLRFELETKTIITYHLIDKSGNEIFEGEIKSKNPRLTLPAEYVSPLVETYTYYPTSAREGEGITEITEDTGGGESKNDPDYEVWVTYTANEDYFGMTHPHLLKFHNGGEYYLEDGSDKLTKTQVKAVYPYCNGDGHLNIYGQAMNDEQMAGGSNTRSRWVWFFESENNDPYHVKIHSKNQIEFKGIKYYTYMQTSAVNFNEGIRQTIVTGANTKGISLIEATEYMILGTTGRYKLLTTNKVAADLNGDKDTDDTVDGVSENARRYVTSFEQYWKTYNMIKLHVLGINPSGGDTAEEDKDTPNASITVPEKYRPRLSELHPDWHRYDVLAYAVRWNNYNDDNPPQKGNRTTETQEHWFQTFDMGDGTFDIENADIPPVLVLLDRHGWEIMRKPIPTGKDDPDRDIKLDALRAFDSPMVKEYKFYSNAQKGHGCHKYALRIKDNAERDTISYNGKHFTSTSLAILPPFDAKGVKDSYGAVQDHYVTYTVKEEYEKSYKYELTYSEIKEGNKIVDYNVTETGIPSSFVILQNGKYAKDEGTTSITATNAPTNLSNEIISDNGKSEGSKTFTENCLWYIQPNLEIDQEMGVGTQPVWAEELNSSLEPYMENETKVKYKDKTGFDPYNIQIENANTHQFFTINMTKSVLSGGSYIGDYTGGSLNVTLAAKNTTPVPSEESYEHSILQMTNQTFMAVQDKNGNMQLMPRFDHSKRIDAFATLEPAKVHEKAAVDEPSPGEQTTFMVRPVVYDYRILDNDGNIAMHYQTGGEFYPSMPEHFKSPLAKDFKFYFGHAAGNTPKTCTKEDYDVATNKVPVANNTEMETYIKERTTTGDYYFKIGTTDFTYKKVTVTNVKTTTTATTKDDGIFDDVKSKKDISNREITSSFAAAGIEASADIFIRYEYDKEIDNDHDQILKGRWMTMSIGGSSNDQWVYYNGTLNNNGAGIYTDTKPITSPTDELKNAKQWQWKFLQNPYVSTSTYYKAPDPYAVTISNRQANGGSQEAMNTAIKVDNIDRFVLLSHTNGDYAFAAAGDNLEYSFLNGGDMTAHNAGSPKAASIASEAGFTTADNPTLTPAVKVKFQNDIECDYTYKIINNAHHLAAQETQNMETVQINSFQPVVPTTIQSAVIDNADYLFYITATESAGTYTIDTQSQINSLYGLYGDEVYVRYPEFNRERTPYMVPNERNNESPVAVSPASNDVAIDINGKLPYNIIWLDDNLMTKGDGTNNITDKADNDHKLSPASADMWLFEDNDPYAIKIRVKDDVTEKYINGTSTLSATPKTYMLLKKEGYDYGVFAETGNQNYMLTYGDDPSTTEDPINVLYTTNENPQKFIPFALSVYHLIYHLVIANTGNTVNIPYRSGTEQSPGALETKTISGTTQRDLTSTENGVSGDKYQLGNTINGQTYSFDAGKVSLGDALEVPSDFDRPNCDYQYYIEGVYTNVNCEEPIDDLNKNYKGLEVNELMFDNELIGKTVRVNIRYSFAGSLKTNAGNGFVTDVNANKWYTFETAGATPYLAHYTNAWGLQAMKGRETRYTNDYLWTPLGDVYGFKMYNRYVKKNSSITGDDDSRVMTFSGEGVEGTNLKMAKPGTGDIPSGNEVYELLANETTTPGYFLIHPVINRKTDPNQYYIRKDPNDDYAKLSTTATEWTFGLSPMLIQPYFDRVGYPGGLKKSVYDELKEDNYASNDPKKGLFAAFTNGTASAAQLMTLQSIVYDIENIEPFSTGFYRLHNQPGVSGINPVRYASGYLHDIERTYVSGGIPMHFYSRINTSTTFEAKEGINGLNSGFTKSPATQGHIPVIQTEYDPSTIFYINGTVEEDNQTFSTATIKTQGLNVVENRMTKEATGTTFKFMDIGGAVFLIVDKTDPETRNYLNFDQSYEDNGEKMIYDLKFYHNVPTDDAKWCFEPAAKQGLVVQTHRGGDGYLYATFYAPFDVLLPDDNGSRTYNAYYYKDGWPTSETMIHPVRVPEKKVTEDITYAIGKFVPAGTPAILRTSDDTGEILKMELSLPNTSTQRDFNCVFTGQYLEQLLSNINIASGDRVYTFGLPFNGYTLNNDGTFSGEAHPTATSGVGFYLNSNPNKESNSEAGDWIRNNRYVLHNKIYYRYTPSGSRELTRSPEFIPVVFDDDEGEEDEPIEESLRQQVFSGCVYDLQGRCVATEEMVKDGTWRHNLKHGIYILNGKKIYVK